MKRTLLALVSVAALAFAGGYASAANGRLDQWNDPDWDSISIVQTPSGAVQANIHIHAASLDGGEPYHGDCSAQLAGAQLTAAQNFAANRLAACAAAKRF